MVKLLRTKVCELATKYLMFDEQAAPEWVERRTVRFITWQGLFDGHCAIRKGSGNMGCQSDCRWQRHVHTFVLDKIAADLQQSQLIFTTRSLFNCGLIAGEQNVAIGDFA